MEEGLRRVLVVDLSKVARSALAKHLRENFDVREEADGESAWQTLVLDPAIIAVVSSTQLPRLSGLDLLARIRISKLRRICDIPFLLLVSGNESVEDRLRAQNNGVTDFLTRGMTRDDIVARISRLVNWEFATDLTNSQIIPASVRHDNRMTQAAPEPHWTPLDKATLLAHLEASTVHLAARNGMVGVITFGLDDAGSLAGQYGQKALLTIARRLGKILHAKIGKNDRVGCDAHGRCIIVSPDSSPASCLAFAQRVCRGVAQSHVAIAGTPINFKVSAGIASLPADEPRGAEQLLDLAYERLQRAQNSGGGLAIGDDEAPETAVALTPDILVKLERFCTNGSEMPLGSIGLELMPLLKLMNKEFEFGLSLEAIEQRFRERAKNEAQA